MGRNPRNFVTDETEMSSVVYNERQPLRAYRKQHVGLSQLETFCVFLWSLSWAMYFVGSFSFAHFGFNHLNLVVALFGFWILWLTGISFLLIKISLNPAIINKNVIFK